jgi:prepilin signal peptidase PulO-like enzyme (type II secretory pathway)
MDALMILTYFFLFCFGAILGSFLNVLILRIHNDENWWTDRSKCPNCQKTLDCFELIPILSYLLQDGKCKKCKKRISIQYPIVEFGAGLLSIISYFLFGPSFFAILFFFLSYFLIGSFISDLKYMELPEFFSYAAILIGLIYIIFFKQSDFLNHLFASILGYLFFWIQHFLTKGRGIGEGDLKLGLIIGLFLGFPLFLYSITASYLFATFLLIPLLLLKKVHRKTKIPLGAFLIPVFLVFFAFSDRLEVIIYNFLLFPIFM